MTTSPSDIKDKCSFIFNSGNEGFVTVNDGVLLGRSAGTTIINIIASYKDRTINKVINVTVGNVSEESSGGIVSSRTPTDIVISNPIEEINVGEYYPLMATAIPYDIMDENLVKFSSSDPEVCSVDYGVLEAHKEGNAQITVSTLNDSISTSFNLKINPELDKIDNRITKIKNLTLSESGLIENDNSYLTAKNNTISLQNIINEAINNNYQKLVLPNGKFYITPEVELVPESEKQLLSGWSTPSYSITINKPGDDVFVLDFNGSEFEIIQSYWTLWKYGRENENSNKNGYRMFTITENSSNVEFRNGTINGERYTATYPESEFDASEMCMSLNLNGTNNGIYNMSFNNSPGFNVGFSQTRNIIHNGVPYTNFEAGGFDDNGDKLESIEAGTWRTIDLMEVNKISNSYAFGFIFGYQGFSYLRSRLYSIYFYDENRNFIECQKYNLQYYKYTMPQNTKYYGIEIYQENAPTSGYGDYNNAVANLYEPIGEKCYIKNCTFKNNYSSAIALTTRNTVLENNILENNGQRAPLSGFVFEDGWENMIGNIIINNKFSNNGQGLCTCAGNSFVIYNNIFENDLINIYSRTQHTRMYKNILVDTSINFSTQGDSVFAKNSIGGNCPITYGKHHENANYEVRVIE